MTYSQTEKKFEFPAKRGFKLWKTEKSRKQKASSPQLTPTGKLSMTFMVWNICVGQLGYLSGYALLPPTSCQLAH